MISSTRAHPTCSIHAGGEQNEQSTRSTERWLVEYRLRLQSFLQNTHPLFQIFDKALLLGGSPKLLEQVAATQDVGMIEVPENCETVQVANSLLWTDIGVYQLGVLREFWEAATPKERALFLIHEAGHTYFTQATANPAVGSEKLRAFVGYLYIGGASVFRYKAEIEKLL